MDANARPTALLIDDEPSSSDVHKDRLERRGYRVLVAGDKAEGLSQARRTVPNAIFVHLAAAPGGNLALLQALRSDDTCRHIPIVVIRDTSERLAASKLKAVRRDGW